MAPSPQLVCINVSVNCTNIKRPLLGTFPSHAHCQLQVATNKAEIRAEALAAPHATCANASKPCLASVDEIALHSKHITSSVAEISHMKLLKSLISLAGLAFVNAQRPSGRLGELIRDAISALL